MEKTAPRRAISGQPIPPRPIFPVGTGGGELGPQADPGSSGAGIPSVSGAEAVPPVQPMTVEESLRLRAFLKERRIDTLIHFTRLENLASILSYGLLSRGAIATDPRVGRVRTNEPELPEAWRDMISLNISFPNYRLFYQMQAMRGFEWVVLAYDAALLLQLPFFSFIFPAANLIRTPVFSAEIAPTLQSYPAFENLFMDTDTVRRRILRIPDAYPTHPYSELLIPGSIANQYLREVHFYNDYKFDQWYLQNESLAGIVDKNLWQVGLTYFSPRMDYANWRTTIR